MRVDPEVNRRKFDLEAQQLKEHQDILRRWGCLVVRAEFPEIDAIFMPKHPLLLIGERRRSTTLHLPRSLGVEEQPMPWPACSGRAFGVRLDLQDYDQLPASVVFMDPFTWSPLPYSACPHGHMFPEDGGAATRVVLEGYPGLGRPFLCVPGVREYHAHVQHADNPWAGIRAHVGVLRVLQLIGQTCIENVQAVFVLASGQATWRPVKRET